MPLSHHKAVNPLNWDTKPRLTALAKEDRPMGEGGRPVLTGLAEVGGAPYWAREEANLAVHRALYPCCEATKAGLSALLKKR